MFYPSTAGSFAPAYTVSRSYYTTAPMSAVLPGQHYYPTMHAAPMAYPATAAPMMYQSPAYGYGGGGGYYGHRPTVILSSPHRHRRSRSRGFIGSL